MILNNLDEMLKGIDELKEEMLTDKEIHLIEYFAVDSDDEKMLRKINRLSSNVRIRTALASNPKTPQDILSKMVVDKIAAVRMALINNPALLILNVVQLTFDADEAVKSSARTRVSKYNEAQGGQPNENAAADAADQEAKDQEDGSNP